MGKLKVEAGPSRNEGVASIARRLWARDLCELGLGRGGLIRRVLDGVTTVDAALAEIDRVAPKAADDEAVGF